MDELMQNRSLEWDNREPLAAPRFPLRGTTLRRERVACVAADPLSQTSWCKETPSEEDIIFWEVMLLVDPGA